MAKAVKKTQELTLEQVLWNCRVDLRGVGSLDKNRDAVLLSRLNGLFPNAHYISAATGEGMDELRRSLVTLSSEARKLLTANIPPTRHDLVAFAHANAQIYEEEYLEDGTLRIVFAIEEKFHSKFMEFII